MCDLHGKRSSYICGWVCATNQFVGFDSGTSFYVYDIILVEVKKIQEMKRFF